MKITVRDISSVELERIDASDLLRVRIVTKFEQEILLIIPQKILEGLILQAEELGIGQSKEMPEQAKLLKYRKTATTPPQVEERTLSEKLRPKVDGTVRVPTVADVLRSSIHKRPAPNTDE